MNEYDIVEYGADPEGEFSSQSSIQKAIEVCAVAGGGRVIVPPGLFVTGTIVLKNNVELHLASGATLLASTNPDDYDTSVNSPMDLPCPQEWVSAAHLIYATNSANIAISGFGTIDGNGRSFFGAPGPGPAPGFLWKKIEGWRPSQLISFFNCSKVKIKDVTIKDYPYWGIWPLGCEDLLIQGVSIENNMMNRNGDGIDIDCCKNVRISDCDITAGDDALTLRSDHRHWSEPRPCENITVTNCVLRSPCCAIRIGFLGDAPIRNAVFSNIVIHDSSVGVDIIVPKVEMSETLKSEHGPSIENISFNNMIMDVHQPFFLWIGENASAPGGIKNIRFSNITAKASQDSYVGGLKDLPVKKVEFNNISIEMHGDKDAVFAKNIPSAEEFRWYGYHMEKGLPYAFFIRNAKNITLRNVEVEWKEIGAGWKNAIFAENVSDLELDGVAAAPPYENSGSSITCVNTRMRPKETTIEKATQPY